MILGCVGAISIHALLAESDYLDAWEQNYICDFYPRSPCGERLRLCFHLFLQSKISIHALLAESDPLLAVVSYLPVVFLSTLSLRRATKRFSDYTGGDGDFYPRSPCGERPFPKEVWFTEDTFLSTLSLRRATTTLTLTASIAPHFYPRSPCGERHIMLIDTSNGELFLSTLSLRRATDEIPYQRQINQFLSTLSLRRATSQQPRGTTRTTYFYPRSPCGERPEKSK